MQLDLHPSINAMRGKSGKWVYKQLGKTSYVSSVPRPSSKPPSATQLGIRDKFLLAINYAKSVVANPQAKAIYEPIAAALKKGVYSLALRDSLSNPKVMEIDTSAYARQAGDTIFIRAVDDFEVTAVDVTIRNGQVVETGPAVKSNDGLGRWVYTATTNSGSGDLSIEAVATDRPGNKGSKTIMLQ